MNQEMNDAGIDIVSRKKTGNISCGKTADNSKNRYIFLRNNYIFDRKKIL